VIILQRKECKVYKLVSIIFLSASEPGIMTHCLHVCIKHLVPYRDTQKVCLYGYYLYYNNLELFDCRIQRNLFTNKVDLNFAYSFFPPQTGLFYFAV
jgi:hypothetical protein